MRLLVTGAGGFIGSHLVEALVRRDFDVRAMVHYNSRGGWGLLEDLPSEIVSEIQVIPGDIRDATAVRSALSSTDAVLHLAALIGIPYSYVAPESYVDTNIHGTLNVLQGARDLGLQRVVHTSTSEVYGSAQFSPMDESHPIVSQSPYSATKVAADQLAYSFYASFGTPVTTVRPFNTYGPRQSARAVIPSVITQIASGSREISLGLTAPTRDFNYVQDTVNGFIAALLSDRAVGQTVNIGSGYEVSISELVGLIAEVMGEDVSVTSDPARLRPTRSEVGRLLCDNRKAADLLGWRPKFSGPEGLRSGLARTIDWFMSPRNLAGYRPSLYQI